MWAIVLFIATGVCSTCVVDCVDLEEQFHVLSKQVTVLLERRKEDMKSIEDNIRKTIYNSPELINIHNEVQNLRLEVEQLRSGKIPKPHLEKNDQLTIKWIFNAVEEMKTEVAELQSTLNSSIILQNHEHVKTEFSILKSDISNLNSELEETRKRNAKYEAELQIFREEFQSIKENWRSTAEMCGITKNQLKAMHLEWNKNWKILNEKSPLLENEILIHPSRHQKIIKRHIINLEKSSKTLHKENYFLKTKFIAMEDEIKALRTALQSKHEAESKETYDRINGNEIENYIQLDKIREIQSPDDKLFTKLLNVTEQQQLNMKSIFNLTKQLSNFDKLHLSMLELLENVETIENKVDKNFPDFRNEISKLEVQVLETSSAVSLLKEDQKNIIESLKAISFTVSNMQQKTNEDHRYLEQVNSTLENLLISSNIQTSKLHDHILKEESSSLNLNATKATVHLVQELKSFESEYKSIVNKLPRDCESVDGPSGVYLISPGDGEPILAYCDNGWTIVQKRYDGSLNFNRNWNEYSNGFGSATGEHWLGNRNLHYLTKNNCSQLQINMKDIYGKYWQANYADFRVADYILGFKLTVGRYNGNASDALNYQNLMEFSTIDNDRDISNTHCASNYEGGWWFSHCQHANLNGRYNLGLTWFDSSRNEWIAVSNSEMRVKRRDVC